MDRADEDCLSMKRTIFHLELFKKPYYESGGKDEDWTGYKEVLAQMAKKVPAILEAGGTCGACNEIVEEGHLDMDFQRFAAYIRMRYDYQLVKREVLGVRSDDQRRLEDR